MAILIACGDGNFTVASTWALSDATAFLRAQSNNTALTTSYVESAAFIPGAITIDGIAVMICSRAASPSGTISVRLARVGALPIIDVPSGNLMLSASAPIIDFAAQLSIEVQSGNVRLSSVAPTIAGTGATTVPGTEVTLNVADLPTCSNSTATTIPATNGEGGWILFKLAAPVTLFPGTSYTVSAKTSVASQVNLYRNATTNNWSRILRTTTTQAPVAGDDLVIGGEFTGAGAMTTRTVTMNSTATTDYGSNSTSQVDPALAICKGGTLAFGTAAATAYRLRLSGHLIVYNGGTFRQGVTGTEVPRDSTAELQFDCGSAGAFGFIARAGFDVSFEGLSRTAGIDITHTKLTADVAAAGTSSTTTVATGWKSGDVIALAPTNRPASTGGTTTAESVTLSGDASGTSIAFSAVANAHSGTSPTQAEVGLLTRNVVVKHTTSTFYTFVLIASSGTFKAMWAEFSGCGSNNTNKWGVTFETGSGSSKDFKYCSMHDNAYQGVTWRSNIPAFNCEHCVTYLTANSGINVESQTIDTYVVNNNVVIRHQAAGGFSCQDIGGTWTNNSASGGTGAGNGGFILSGSGAMGTFSGNSSHSEAGECFAVTAGIFFTGTNAFENCTWWYGGFVNGGGWNLSPAIGDLTTGAECLRWRNCTAFGNNHSNLNFSGGVYYYTPVILETCTFNGATGNATASGFSIAGNTHFNSGLYLYNCDFSTASGIKTAHTTDLAFVGNTEIVGGLADNCKFGAATILSNNTGFSYRSSFSMQRLQQTDATHRTYKKRGLLLSNNSIFNTQAPSEEMQPNSSTNKLESGRILIPANDGDAKTVTVYVRKSATYNGAAPRLMLRRQEAQGVTADTVCDTLSVAADTWEALTYTTGAALDHGAFEFYVDCDGTAGSVFLDDVSVS